MPFSFANFAASPMGMFLVLLTSAFFLGFLIYAVARPTLLPTVYRYLVEHSQQQQAEIERKERLRFYLDDVRRRAVTAAAAAEYAERVEADRAWLRDMEDAGRRQQEAIQAQEPTVAARRAQAQEFGLLLRRDLEVKLGLLEASDQKEEDAAAAAKHWANEQHPYRPEKGGLLYETYESDEEDAEVSRGDWKGKKEE